MTSEIIIMNRTAIAMAADSAVTFSGHSQDKIFPSAQKLFTLSNEAPVGIMVYGNASFMGVPWETIIKVYRNEKGNERFDKLEDYANDFISYLNENQMLFPEEIQHDMFVEHLNGYLSYVKDEFFAQCQKVVHSEQRTPSEIELKNTLTNIVENQYLIWEKANRCPGFSSEFDDKVLSEYDELIEHTISQIFEEFPIGTDNIEKIKKIIPWLFSKYPKDIRSNSYSGIVISGFGDKEIFPSFKSYFIEFMTFNKLKYEIDGEETVSSKSDSVIKPFAQREMVDIFMRGIDPSIFNFSISFLQEAINELCQVLSENENINLEPTKEKTLENYTHNIISGYVSKMNQLQNERYISPITNVVSMLPKDELASMAKSLINLTSFKRKISLDSETVGGPIDVAVISKGDGFIWINRKHYFKSDLNPQFFINKYKRAYIEKEGEYVNEE
jgi:hypothetical protein